MYHYRSNIYRTLVFGGIFLLGGFMYTPSAIAEDDPAKMVEQGELAYTRGDVVDAIRWYRKAAEQGHPPGQTRLARILDASEQNDEAVKWYRKAAEQGFAEAEFELGVLYSNGEGVPKDYAQAMHWLQRAVDHGYVAAMRVLAIAYESGGMGQQQDFKKAVALWERGVELGDAASIQRLAKAYRKGELGLGQDPQRAASLEAKLPQDKSNAKDNEKKP